MANSNGYSVSSWRDDVSKTLGSLETGIKNIDKKLDAHLTNCNKISGAINKDVDGLKTAESTRSAVQKKMHALTALIVTVATAIANIAWQLVK